MCGIVRWKVAPAVEGPLAREFSRNLYATAALLHALQGFRGIFTTNVTYFRLMLLACITRNTNKFAILQNFCP